MDTTTANGVNSIEPPGRPQLHNLTALRAFAALSIFIHHLKSFGIDASQSIRNMDLGCAVSFFFVLSGFVLSYSFAGRFFDWRDVRHFVFQRFFRLWPVHMLCSFFALVTLHGPASLLTAYLTTTLQSSWIPTYGTAYAYNGVSWSISVELFFYLLLPFILILRPNQVMLVICGWTLAVLGLLAFTAVLPGPVFPPSSERPWLDFYVTDASFVQLFPPLRTVEFLSGIAVYQLFRLRRIPAGWLASTQIAAIACLVLYAGVHDEITRSLADHASVMASVAYREYGMYPVFAALVYVFAHQSGAVTRVLSCRPLIFCGEISFAFYMIHQIVIFNLAYNYEFDKHYGPIAATISAAILSLGLSVILHRTAEKPAIAWAKRRFPMSRLAPSSPHMPLAALV
ncbi:acyltransferase [Mesorhizobium sp. AR02]|uniref:acyltransferase family protein n=1 Tax=Mesorhizobium sp. AR02 TaxID=2865837 RepID=UPI002160084A|nr:acyltransferase [Mesorhizobium sp. AR02]UVK54042.1 acyltransferase [Mesorhizobium sp. AR02]